MRPLLLLTFQLTLTAGSVVAQVPRKPVTSPAPPSGNLPSPVQPGTLLAPAVPGYPKGYTNKHVGGTTSSTFPDGLPERNLDNGTSRADQPRAGQAQSGARPTRSILRSRKR